MESLQIKVTELTGALNAVLSQLKILDQRTKTLENRPANAPAAQSEPSTSAPPLRVPVTEEELNSIGKLPDCIKELQPFEGNPTHYVSWVHSVESILADYQIVRNKPIYRAIMQAIRRKCRGSADAALTSYNIFEEDWEAIKNCLSLHYADKRDVQTLEHQLNQLTQRTMSVDEFYAKVNHQFSLIINKIKTQTYSEETVSVLIETYRNRALDVFIRGLNGELSKLVMLMKPKTLPEAYSQCIEMQNANYRTHVSSHPVGMQNKFQTPVGFPRLNLPNSSPNRQVNAKPLHRFSHQNQYRPHLNPFVNRQYGQQSHAQQPGPERPVPMDVDPSTQSRRPANNFNRNFNKRRAFSEQIRSGSTQRPMKQQRLFNITQETDSVNDDGTQQVDEELNFMTCASQAYHI